MATTEEIARRVQQADTARSIQRTAAAQRVGELAQRRAALAEQLDEIERSLGTELAAAREVMDIEELAAFTDVPAADLTRWLSARTTRPPNRATRKRAAEAADGERATRTRRSTVSTATARAASTRPAPAAPRTDGAEQPTRVPAEVV